MLDQTIDLVFRRLHLRLTGPDAACAAIKQLVRVHVRLRPADVEMFERFADMLFRRHNGHNTVLIANELKGRIERMHTKSQVVEWLNA